MSEIDPVTLRLFVEDRAALASLKNYTRVADQQFSLVERAAGRLSGVLAGVSAVALARSFLEIADTAKTLDAQLRLATAGFGTFEQAQDDVRKIAAETRSGLTETADLYGNLARTSKEIGSTQAEAAQATETFTKALKIGGAGAAQVTSATFQMGQALSSATVEWEDLGQVLEASPRLARVFTDSLGITRQELKKMASDGKLSGQMLYDALNDKKITAGIDAEFAQLPVTFEQAMSQVENAAIITFGGFDRGGQFSTALANFITDGSDGFNQLERDAVEMGIAVRSNIEGLVGAFEPIFDEARRFFDYVNGQQVSINIKRDIDASAGQVDRFTKWLSGDTGFEKWVNKALTGRESIGTDFQGRFRRSQGASETQLRRNIAAQDAKDRQAPPNSGSTPRRASGPSDADKKKAAAAAKKAEREAEAAAKKAERERIAAIRDDASKARESAQLQDDINAAKAAMAVATRDVLQYNLNAIDSEEKQRVAEYTTQRELGELTDQELKDRKAAVAEIADLQRQRVRQIADEAERREKLDQAQASNQNQQDLYRAEMDLLDLRDDRHAVELRLLDLAYQQERNELEATIASGTATQAAKDIAKARLAILGQLQGYDEQAIGRRYESPLEQRRREVRQTTANMGDAIEDLELDALDRLTDGLADASTEFIKLGGVAGDVLNGIIQGLVKLAAQQAIFGKTGSGGIIGAIGGLLGIASRPTPSGSAAFNAAFADLSSIPKHALGTNFAPGGLSLVGERGPELVKLPRGSQVIPNSRLNGMGGAATIQIQLTEDLNGRIASVSSGVAVQIVRQNAPAIAGAGATAGSTMARDRMMRSARNRLPG